MPARTDFTPFGYRVNDAMGSLCPTCTRDILVGEGLHPIEVTHVLSGEAWEVVELWPVRFVPALSGCGLVISEDERWTCVKDKKNDFNGEKFFTLLLASIDGNKTIFQECEGLRVYPILSASALKDQLVKVMPCDRIGQICDMKDAAAFVVCNHDDAIQVYFPNVQVAPNMRGPITRALRRIDRDMSASCPPDELSIAAGDAEDEDEYCNICSKLLMVEFKKRSILGGIDFVSVLEAMQEEDPHNSAYTHIKHDFNGMYHRDLLDWYLTHTERLTGSLYGIDPDFKKRTVYRVLCRVNSLLCMELSKPGPQ
jgi:hypothetical protein